MSINNYYLKNIIDSCVLTVSTNTPISDIYKLFIELRQSFYLNSDELLKNSCIFVVDNNLLVGLVTEQDFLGYIANKVSFKELSLVDIMQTDITALKESSLQDITKLVTLFTHKKNNFLSILDDNNNFLGIITPKSIYQYLQKMQLLENRTVADIFNNLNIYASVTSSVQNIVSLMVEHSVLHVIIAEEIDENPLTPIAIITAQDILNVQSSVYNSFDIKALNIVNSPLIYINLYDTLWTAYQYMYNHKVQQLLVSGSNNEFIGIVTLKMLLQTVDSIAFDNYSQMRTQNAFSGKTDNFKEVEQLKSHFISTVSHEFRTPLTTILGSAELLKHYGQNWSEEKKIKHLERIQNTVAYMTELLNTILTTNRF